METDSKFRITEGKGFQMSFENGLTISVQFGYGNYCANKNEPTNRHSANTECYDAEIAIFPTKDKGPAWLTNKFLPKKRGEDVVGWIKPDEVAKLIGRVQRSKILTHGPKLK